MSISRETELKHDGNNRSLAYQRGVLCNWKAKYGGLEVSGAKAAASCLNRS
jgi:hypothetical protein